MSDKLTSAEMVSAREFNLEPNDYSRLSPESDNNISDRVVGSITTWDDALIGKEDSYVVKFEASDYIKYDLISYVGAGTWLIPLLGSAFAFGTNMVGFSLYDSGGSLLQEGQAISSPYTNVNNYYPNHYNAITNWDAPYTGVFYLKLDYLKDDYVAGASGFQVRVEANLDKQGHAVLQNTVLQGSYGDYISIGVFDVGYYIKNNPDVAAAGVDIVAHFINYGWPEGRDPSPFFDVNYYLDQNPDVASAGINPLEHFMTSGWSEGRNPGPHFNTVFYLQNNADVTANGINPLEHFLRYGWQEGRNPGPDFDVNYYLSEYPDVAASGMNPLGHYLEYGMEEGRLAIDPLANYQWEAEETTSESSILSVIVAPGIIAEDAVLLKELDETIVTKWINGISKDHLIEYNGVSFDYNEIDYLITTVTRDGEFTEEFREEIFDFDSSYASTSYQDAVTLVGVTNIDNVLLAVAGADGMYVA